MARPRSNDPRREIAKTHLTKNEKISLDTLKASLFPRLTMSDFVREIILAWIAEKQAIKKSTAPEKGPRQIRTRG